MPGVFGGMASQDRPLSEGRKNIQLGAGCLRLFGLPFLLIGLGLLNSTVYQPWVASQDAKRWVEVPCRIEASSVKQAKNSDGDPTFALVVQYRYRFEEREFTGTRYQFVETAEGAREASKLARLAEYYAPGEERTCFVNPKLPSAAVLDRTLPSRMWLGLMGLPFALVGGFLVFIPARLVNPQKNSSTADDELLAGELTLVPQERRWIRFVGLLLFAMFWNGFLGGAWFFAGKLGKPGVAGAVLFIFGAIGVGILGAAIYQGLRLLTPTIKLTLRPGQGQLGERLQVRWEFARTIRALQRLQLQVVGTEVTTYVRGTDRRTDRAKFCQLPVVDATEASTFQQGDATVLIPAGLVPTFRSDNNEVEWVLRVTGTMRGLPDLKETFLFKVRPLAGP